SNDLCFRPSTSGGATHHRCRRRRCRRLSQPLRSRPRLRSTRYSDRGAPPGPCRSHRRKDRNRRVEPASVGTNRVCSWTFCATKIERTDYRPPLVDERRRVEIGTNCTSQKL